MFVHPDFLSGLFAAMEKTPHQQTRYGAMADPQLGVPLGLGHHSSVNSRVAGPALRAVDEEAMHLIVLGVQQDRPAVAA